MERTTIDFGIDLGTTNSAIAVVRDVGTEIIKNNDDTDITPSAVSLDRSGEVFVGIRAKNRSAQYPQDAYREFKRRMGTDFVYRFRQAGAERKPEELSAEVLKDLKASVQQRTGEVIDAAVITVPAAFELPQCDATRRAAQLAGLLESPLLQEPVAAALAYGFQVNTQKAYWLVYDFGGGTFDAALVKAEEGTIRVVNHGGDNFLGGSDIDLAIVNEIVAPRLVQEYGLQEFTLTNKKWEAPFARLRAAAERAKIDLSRPGKTEASLEEFEFDDGNGNTVVVDHKISLADLKRVAERFIRRSTEICRRVVAEKSLGKGAIERVILVGGPTLAPYFRGMLAEQLGMTIDHSVDPLTVVARGGAIFASTQRRAARAAPKPSDRVVTVELKYNPVGVDPSPLVGGKLVPPTSVSLNGFTVELVHQKSKWRSGKMPVNANGIFTATLRAEPGQRNTYAIELADATGTKWATSPNILTYTIGAAVSEQVLPHAIGLSLADNRFARVFERGTPLPARSAAKKYLSDVALKRGETGSALKIPVCEGESTRGDRNRLVGSLEISATDIPRDLPRGNEIEITMRIDESRKITVEAYVPLLDQDFKAEITSGLRARDVSALRSDVRSEVARIGKLKVQAREAAEAEVLSKVQALEGGDLLREVQALSRDAEDPDASAKCESRLLELRLRIDEVEDRLEWPRLAVETEDFITKLLVQAAEHGNPQQKSQAQAVSAELRGILKTRDAAALREQRETADGLFLRLIAQDPAFWVYMFQEAEKKADLFKDPERGRRLLEQGRAFISHGNVDGLMNVVRSLHQLLPEEKLEELRLGYEAGIRAER